MFPAIFSKVTSQGAPIAGMIILGIVQTLMALMTISPTLSVQFSALVNLAVVTNVLPYLIALSALPWMLESAGVKNPAFRRTVTIAAVAMLYSVYALYASGKDAIFGGMFVVAIGYVIWGFIASRFAPARPLEHGVGEKKRLPVAV
jgi:putrescine:ornithine antiporter